MSCAFSIATRTGLHLACVLEENHEGACVPALPRVPVQPHQLPNVVASREAEFMLHLLAVVEAAGDQLTYAEALNVARSLCRARLGIPEKRA